MTETRAHTAPSAAAAGRLFLERIEAEDAEAERMLQSIVGSQYLFTKANITRHRRFRTGGVVRRLCERAWEECQREPRFASVLAETAAAIADALPTSTTRRAYGITPRSTGSSTR